MLHFAPHRSTKYYYYYWCYSRGAEAGLAGKSTVVCDVECICMY